MAHNFILDSGPPPTQDTAWIIHFTFTAVCVIPVIAILIWPLYIIYDVSSKAPVMRGLRALFLAIIYTILFAHSILIFILYFAAKYLGAWLGATRKKQVATNVRTKPKKKVRIVVGNEVCDPVPYERESAEVLIQRARDAARPRRY